MQKKLPDPTLPSPGSVYLQENVRPVARPATSRSTAIPTTQLDSQSLEGGAPVKPTRPDNTGEKIKRLTAATPSRAPTLKPVNRSLDKDLETVASSPNEGSSSLVFPNGHDEPNRKPLVEMTPPVPSPSTPPTRKELGGNHFHYMHLGFLF